MTAGHCSLFCAASQMLCTAHAAVNILPLAYAPPCLQCSPCASRAAVKLAKLVLFPVQVWASYLACHFVSGPDTEGSAGMGSLLQLLVSIASQQQEDHSPTRAAAAAAVRALTSAALHLGWDKLYLGTPLLLQVCCMSAYARMLLVFFWAAVVATAEQSSYASNACCFTCCDVSHQPPINRCAKLPTWCLCGGRGTMTWCSLQAVLSSMLMVDNDRCFAGCAAPVWYRQC